MRIISNNKCNECCYCVEDYDGFGICCKDNIYKNIKPNQQACRFFCDDNNTEHYNNLNQINNDNDEDEFDMYD